MDNKRFEDTLGFEIRGLKEAKTIDEKIKAIEYHKELIEGLTNEAIHDLEKRIHHLRSEKQPSL